MTDSTDRPIRTEEVEAFYARQERQILDRLDEERTAKRVVAFPARRWIGLGLAAAAALVLTFVAFQRRSLDPAAGDLVIGTIPSEMASVPAELEAFGVWTEAELAAEPAPVEREEMESLAWLLDEERGEAADALPAFLEPFGTWETEDEVLEETT